MGPGSQSFLKLRKLIFMSYSESLFSGDSAENVHGVLIGKENLIHLAFVSFYLQKKFSTLSLDCP